jgi:hypothetical protein
MAERKTGAGAHLSGVLEQSRPHRSATPAPSEPVEVEPTADAEPAAERGRGAARGKTTERSRAERAQKGIKGRTIYLNDDLFERILVQAHRKGKTISEYVASVLESRVPDHRFVRASPSASSSSEVAEE